MTYVAIAVLVVASVVVGLWHARVEARMIAENIACGTTEELPHVDLWLHRAALLFVPVVVVSLLLPWDLRSTLAAIAVEYGAFAVTHRAGLNALRKLPATYVAPGNAYDRLMLRVAWVTSWGNWPSQGNMVSTHKLYGTQLGAAYHEVNAKAGRIAYVVEAIVCGLGVAWILH